MRFGLNVVPVYPFALPDVAMRAEKLGFESLWVGEHVAVPYDVPGGYPGGRPPFRPDSHFVEPFVTIAHLAGVTSSIRLGTGVAIFPLRSPLHLARTIAATDVFSNGRLSLGIGVGWLKDEFDIVGQPWEHRGQRLDECLQVLDRLFNDERPEFHGRFYELPAIGFEPKPVQRPHPPFLVGGSSPAALRRAARVGDGWYGGMQSPADAETIIGQLHQMRTELEREGPFEITVIAAWGAAFDRAVVDSYEAVGVDRLVVTPRPRSSRVVEGMEAFAAAASEVGSMTPLVDRDAISPSGRC